MESELCRFEECGRKMFNILNSKTRYNLPCNYVQLCLQLRTALLATTYNPACNYVPLRTNGYNWVQMGPKWVQMGTNGYKLLCH
jgi:hypothetical protein